MSQPSTAPESPPASVLEALRAQIVDLSEGEITYDAVDPSANLLDYGYVNSLTAVMFMEFIGSEYGVHLDDLDLIERLTTLELIAREIEERG